MNLNLFDPAPDTECPYCMGTGTISDNVYFSECYDCGGTGTIAALDEADRRDNAAEASREAALDK